jgi:transposase-like protein
MARHVTPEQRARLVARYRASGLTQREFAEREGVTLSALQGWLYRRGKSSASCGRFVEVVPATPTERVEVRVGSIRIVLPAAASADRIAAIVRALDSAESAK